MASQAIPVASVRFVKELYPRVREDAQRIEQFRETIDLLPPIQVARDGILVDGFHRWQAHRREQRETIPAENLGNLSDLEIFAEACRRNATGVMMLSARDKRSDADKLYRLGIRDYGDIAGLLSITGKTAQEYCRDARRDEKQAQQDQSWDLWLDCLSYREIAAKLGEDGPDEDTVGRWVSAKTKALENADPPESRQHFDIWQFQTADGDSAYFGKMPPQVVENLLWLFTEPGQVVVDPFAGGGTTIDVAKAMGRRVWASDLRPSTPTLPIHQHDITEGWPASAPRKADLVLLDPPYWQQAKGRYSQDGADLANMTLDQFYDAWTAAVKACQDHAGRIAYIISPTQLDDGTVVDHATDMLAPFLDEGWRVERRIIVPYQTQQATGQQVEWARENKRLLKLYRDLVVMTQ